MVVVSKEDLVAFKKMEIMSEMSLLSEHTALFNKKYGCSLDQFNERIRKSEEDYSSWDDFIEWKAYEEKIAELRSLLERLNAEDIEIR